MPETTTDPAENRQRHGPAAPAHFLTRRRLYIDVQHGLCNRLRAMASAAVIAALAEQERAFISARTKAALAEAKAKGKKLRGAE